MKNLLIVLLLSCVLFGCMTKKGWERKFPPQVETVIEYHTDTLEKETIVYKDSIVNIQLPKDTVTIYKYINANGETVNLDTIILEKGIVGAKAWITNNHLGVVAYVSDSTIFYQLHNARVIVNKQKRIISNYKEKKTEVHERWYVPKIMWWLYIVAFGLGIFIDRKYLSKLF